jgi:hypothetical protein
MCCTGRFRAHRRTICFTRPRNQKTPRRPRNSSSSTGRLTLGRRAWACWMSERRRIAAAAASSSSSSSESEAHAAQLDRDCYRYAERT